MSSRPENIVADPSFGEFSRRFGILAPVRRAIRKKPEASGFSPLTSGISGSILNLPVLSGENMARPKLDPNEPHAAPQVTLNGRSAYVLLELAKFRGGEADAARWIIEAWIGGEGRKILLEQYGIDVLAYRPASNVVPIGRRIQRESTSDGGAK